MIELKDPRTGTKLTRSAQRPSVSTATSPPAGAVIGLPVGSSGAVASDLGLERATLRDLGFDGKSVDAPRAQARPVPGHRYRNQRHRDLNATRLRDAAAAFARAAGKHAGLATSLADAGSVRPEVAGQAVVEGVMLARYRYDELKTRSSATPLHELTLVTKPASLDATAKGAERGRLFAEAGMLARDLANMPPAYLTATRMAESSRPSLATRA